MFSFRLKSHPDRLLRDHLSEVGRKCRKLMERLSRIRDFSGLQVENSLICDLASIVGYSHDIGKGTRYFQDYLSKTKMPTDIRLKTHSILSAIYGGFAVEQSMSGPDKLKEVSSLLVPLVIQAHHGFLKGPTDWAPTVWEWRKIICAQVESVDMAEADSILAVPKDVNLPPFSDFARNIQQVLKAQMTRCNRFRGVLDYYRHEPRAPFFTANMVLSVLVDADKMDAASIQFPERTDVCSDNVGDYVKALSERSRLQQDANDDVRSNRDRLFNILTRKSSKVPLDKQHIHSLTAPTGCGKTLAVLNFASRLRDRVQSQKDYTPRIIYVAPYLSIIDQNVEEIRKALKVELTQSNVLLLHHHLAETKYAVASQSDETFTTLESELLIEGWNAEIIVTTFVQFFHSVLTARSSQLRKLHNIAGSIVVLDEVQAIPHHYWLLVREVLKFLADRLGMYVILMTATQPLIFARDEVVELADTLPESVWKPRVLIKPHMEREVTLDEFVVKMDEIIRLNTNGSYLIVMNTVSTATEVFNSIRTDLEKYYLSAHVIPAQRSRRIEEIKKRLQERKPLVLVSTQVVEAGIDLDFDLAVRDIGPIDSIIQVAGRCNRNGLKRTEDSQVHVYAIVDDRGNFYAEYVYGKFLVNKSREVLRRLDDSGAPSLLATLPRMYYESVRRGASESASIDLVSSMTDLRYDRLRDFKLIEDEPSCSVFVEVDDQATRIWNRYVEILKTEGDPFTKRKDFLELKHDLNNYVINISQRELRGLTMHEEGGIYHIKRDEVETFYDCVTGLRTTQHVEK